jgi:ABC-type antimicrobial peptide transport system permease subunit
VGEEGRGDEGRGERTAEIGLVQAIRATRRQVHLLFLTEAAALSTVGGALGVLAGMGIVARLFAGR